MSAAAERIDEALRIVRATLGTEHEPAARAELAEAIRRARRPALVSDGPQPMEAL